MSLNLRYVAESTVPVEVEGVIPELVRDKSMAEIERLEVFQGNRKLPLAELFSVSGDPSDGRIDFEGDLAGVHFIGYGMGDGEIHVHGSAGRHLGGGMTVGQGVGEGGARGLGGGGEDGGGVEIEGRAGGLTWS